MSAEVSLTHLPVINFSLQQNHVAVIREIVITNDSDDLLDNAEVTVSFDPDFAGEVTVAVAPVAPRSSTRIGEVTVNVSTSFLSGLTERIDELIKAVLKHNGEVIASCRSEIGLLAFDQWSGLSVLPAMIAAFVTPNHPEVPAIVRRASEILGKWTGSPSMDAYQTRDPNRVKLQMAAIYEAISERKITYCIAPASFEGSGQRIRLYTDLLGGGMGNCIEMTLLYAGCLEAVGLHPLIVFTDGHAFAGGWLIDESFPDSVNDDVSLLSKRVAEGINEILVVETTCMNTGNQHPFDRAREAAEARLDETDKFLLFVDLLRARNARIRPLPLRVMTESGFRIEESQVTEERDAAAPDAIGSTVTVRDVDHIEVTKQTIWERKLLDLSMRNNLINTRITNNTLQLISVNINQLEDALAAGEEFSVLPRPTDWDDPLMSAGIYQAVNASDPIIDLVRNELQQHRLYSYLPPEQLRASLKHLYRSSRLSLEENGANTLYLALGLLKWLETPRSTRPRFAPILLIPIEIVRKNASKEYIIRSRDEETVLNVSLLEMLRQDFGIGIGGLDPLPADASGVDVAQIFGIVRRAVMGMSGWDVEEQAVIGNFSFNKFIMWNDIHCNADKLRRNKIVAGLIDGKAEWEEIEVHEAIDEAYPADAVALPISADSSQFEAICAAVEGKSFILHGPPGTGKSQTITNIIANALYNGKKVLFVAEKMAALQVVQRRLAAIGLDPFCLELHSNKTKKSYILEQLKRTTEINRYQSSDDFNLKARQINELRCELDRQVKALHKVRKAGLSLYDCFGRYATVDYDGPAVSFRPVVMAALTPESLAEAMAAVDDYAAICRVCGKQDASPLLGINLTEYTPAVKAEVRELLEKLTDAIKDYCTLTDDLSASLGVNLAGLSAPQRDALAVLATRLADAPYLSASLLDAATDEMMTETIRAAVATGGERDRLRGEIERDFSAAVLDLDYLPWAALWTRSVDKWFLPRYLDRRKVRSKLRAYSTAASLTDEAIDRLFPLLNDYRREQRRLDSLRAATAQATGALWLTDTPDWQLITDALASAAAVNEAIVNVAGDIALSSALRRALCQSLAAGAGAFRSLFVPRLRELIVKGERVTSLTARVDKLLVTALHADGLEIRLEKASRWLGNLDLLRDHVALNRQRRRLNDAGFSPLCDAVFSGTVDTRNIPGCFARSLYRSYAEHILSVDTSLNDFQGMVFDEKIERFRRLNEEFERLTREELYCRLAAALPALRKEASQSSEVGILQRNIRNGGRGTSIRRLFDQIPELLTRMCPCMLMSPISVAQYIDAGRAPFDLVIFDEASQMPTSEAVGAIARGHSVIVVGDPKQMPPTNFFNVDHFDEDNVDKEDLESILDDCLALSMPSKYLLWHYRSRHESLIAFSNAMYYDNKLLTFPSPDDLTAKVGWEYVEGTYDRGRSRRNKAEAEAVVEEIRRRLSDPATCGQSIGVVTFNSNQQSLIEDLLTDILSANPQLEAAANQLEEPIFVKNLENVQGDERDVILFSIGYGPDREGRVALNFGPLNRDGGGRRLNVAVSRARCEMKVFSSLRADEIDLNRTSAEGVAHLKAFLEYAEKGREFLDRVESADNVTDPLAEAISRQLNADGYTTVTGVGCSGFRIDIGVVDPADPSRFLLGILLDGYRYSGAATARDRVITRDKVLSQLGWRLHRVWAMDWWEKPESTLEGIARAIATAGQSPEPPAKTEPVTPGITFRKIIDEPDSRSENYRSTMLHVDEITPEIFISGLYDENIIAKIRQVMATEAPISRQLLYRKIINSFNFIRLGGRLQAHLDMILAGLGYRVTGSADAQFLWNDDLNPDEYDRYRLNSDRDALDIAPEEYAVAVEDILREQVSLPVDGLKREVMQRLGFARMTDNVNLAVMSGIDCALRRGSVSIDGDRVRLS